MTKGHMILGSLVILLITMPALSSISGEDRVGLCFRKCDGSNTAACGSWTSCPITVTTCVFASCSRCSAAGVQWLCAGSANPFQTCTNGAGGLPCGNNQTVACAFIPGVAFSCYCPTATPPAFAGACGRRDCAP